MTMANSISKAALIVAKNIYQMKNRDRERAITGIVSFLVNTYSIPETKALKMAKALIGVLETMNKNGGDDET